MNKSSSFRTRGKISRGSILKAFDNSLKTKMQRRVRLPKKLHDSVWFKKQKRGHMREGSSKTGPIKYVISKELSTIVFLPHRSLSHLTSAPIQTAGTYRFPRSIGSNQHSQRCEEGDNLLVSIFNPKTPHPKDAHLVYF